MGKKVAAKIKVTAVFGPKGEIVHVPSSVLNSLTKVDSFSMTVQNGKVKIDYTSGTSKGKMELNDVPLERRKT